MADAYQQWLQEQVAYYRNWCLNEAKEHGYTGTDENFAIRYVNPIYREILDTYEDCLDGYKRYIETGSPTLSE
jgi:hypothetical protein